MKKPMITDTPPKKKKKNPKELAIQASRRVEYINNIYDKARRSTGLLGNFTRFKRYNSTGKLCSVQSNK